MYCPNCGAQNADNTAFCGRCGRPMAGPPTQPAGYPSPTQPYAAYPPPPQAPYGQPAYPPAPPGYPISGYSYYGARATYNWKFFLPLIGAVLAFLSFFLPWFHLSFLNFSLSAYNLAARTGPVVNAISMLNMYGDPTGEFNSALAQMGWLWLVPICALLALTLFLRNNAGKLVTIGVATLGLIFMLIFTISLDQAMDSAMSGITNLMSMISPFTSMIPGMSNLSDLANLVSLSNLLGFGYYLAWFGFTIQLVGVFVAWNSIEKR